MLALAMGGHVRVGLEDNLYLDAASKELGTNLALVERVIRVAREMGRAPMPAAEARTLLGLGNP
jgi:uncharacterized protein (DUF849 family)